MQQALVFASIVLGIGLASEINNLHKLLRSDKVRWHWAQPLFALFVLITIMAVWWMLAKGDQSDTITLGQFLPVMWVLILLNLLAAGSLPDQIPDQGLELSAYYQENHRYLWGLYLLMIAPLSINWLTYAFPRTDSWVQYLGAVSGELVAVCFTVFMMFARRWTLVAFGFVVLGALAATWMVRTL